MCKVVHWRQVLAQQGNAFDAIRRLTNDELGKKGEDPAQWALLDKVELQPEGEKRATWFCPTDTENVVDLILGWDHAVLIALVEDHFEVARVFRHANAAYGVSGWDEVETFAEWVVYQPPEAQTVRRVLTYGATSCSVTLMVPEGDVTFAVMCHMDADPPIPLDVVLKWCASKELIKACKIGKPRYKVLSSICSTGEAAKFAADACLDGIDCEAKRLLLVRTTPNVLANVFPEPHTQIGVDFSAGLLAGYLGFPETVSLARQWPHVDQPIHDTISSILTKRRKINDVTTQRALHLQTITSLRQRKTGYQNDFFVFDRENRIKAVQLQIDDVTEQVNECDLKLQAFPVGLPEAAQTVLGLLCSDAYGFPALYADILQRMTNINGLATDEEKVVALVEYAADPEVVLALQQAIPDALREWPKQFALSLASFDTLYN